MARRTTTYRTPNTTVNVTTSRAVGKPVRRATAHRPASLPRETRSSSTTRTIEQVYTPDGGDSATPYLIGGTIVAGGLLYLLWPHLAGAAQKPPVIETFSPPPLIETRQPPPREVPPNGGIPLAPPILPPPPPPPGGSNVAASTAASIAEAAALAGLTTPTTGVTAEREAILLRQAADQKFDQIDDTPIGYAGPGIYRIIATRGLNLRRIPSANPNELIQLLPFKTAVEVVGVTTNGWAQIITPRPGYLCLSCAEAPGGPWLARQS